VDVDGDVTHRHFVERDDRFGAGLAELTVTLPTPKALTKALLRGAQFTTPATVLLEGSTDGITWRSLDAAFCPWEIKAELWESSIAPRFAEAGADLDPSWW